MQPLVSVIATTKDGSIEHAERCIDSIINQNLKDIEILVIDDSFSDEENLIIEGICAKDPRIRYIHRGVAGGVNAARNTGIKCASGTYVTFVDFNDKLGDMLCWILSDYMRDNDAEVCVCGVLVETNTDVPRVGTYDTPDENEIVDSDERTLELAMASVNDGMPNCGFHIEGLNLVGAKMYLKSFLIDCPWVVYPDESTEGDGVIFFLRALDAQPNIYMADVPLYILTDESNGFTPNNDPEFVDHEASRLRAINAESHENDILQKATAREALCSLLNIEKSLRRTKGNDNKAFLKRVLDMPEYYDALILFNQLGFKNQDQYLLSLSKSKKIPQILKEVL